MPQTLKPAYWPPRVPRHLRAPATPLIDNLLTSARRYPDKTALVFLGRKTTYASLLQQVERMAAFMQQLGVKRGDRVLLMMQNCPQLVIAHFAILRADAVVVPVNPMNRAHELAHTITDAGARLAVVADDLAPHLAEANSQLDPTHQLTHVISAHYADALTGTDEPDLPLPAAWRDWLAAHVPSPDWGGATVHDWNAAMACTATPEPIENGPDDLAILPYTSGTTGVPKGCMHPQRTVMYNAHAMNLWKHFTPESISLVAVPMFHITGLVIGLHSTIAAGATMVILPRWDRDYGGATIRRWQVTHWINIPTMVIDLLASQNADQYDLSSLEYIGGGGAAMPQAIAQRLWDLYQLRYCEAYGLTETCGPSHSNPSHATKQQCLGVPYMDAKAIVVDPETLSPLPTDTPGEILIQGPMVFDGYWGRPDATEAAFVTVDGVRYFRTGDLGRIDESGYFFMTDRLKRMINVSGYKVWPAEVEAMLFKHPAIAEACIISIPDDYSGERVHAVVVTREGMTLTEAALIEWARQEMAVYKAPRSVRFVDAIPKSGSGKVMWRVMQEAAWATAKSDT
ncbi:MAG: long-chain-fatty-acid--CoA ligase [Burkholderiaceae bacterium]